MQAVRIMAAPRELRTTAAFRRESRRVFDASKAPEPGSITNCCGLFHHETSGTTATRANCPTTVLFRCKKPWPWPDLEGWSFSAARMYDLRANSRFGIEPPLTV
jgi:hypothetical protein